MSAVIACALAAAPANAAFPGANGLIASVYNEFDRGGGDELALRLLDRSGRARATFARCSREYQSEPISGACPSDPAFSADGRVIAHGLDGQLALQAVSGGQPVVLPKLTERDANPHPSPIGSTWVRWGAPAWQPLR